MQKEIPSTEKAKNLLNFEAKTSLSEMLDIVIPWVKEAKSQQLVLIFENIIVTNSN